MKFAPVMDSHTLRPNRLIYAHTKSNPDGTLAPKHLWETLQEHLTSVADITSQNAAAFGAADWGYLTGLWHDLGKYILEFQRKLSGEQIQIEHSGAGAALAKETLGAFWETIAFPIAGHHSGLANRTSKESMEDKVCALDERIKRAVPMLAACRDYMHENKDLAMLSLLNLASVPKPPQWLTGSDVAITSKWGNFIRMLFSALVDADSIATEAFCSAGERNVRLRSQPIYDKISTLRERLDTHIDSLGSRAQRSAVNQERAKILQWCQDSALLPPGCFTLCVPTGGGKTLAAMSFALRHIEEHSNSGMRRVIVAVPYTSVIEQNAKVYGDALGEKNILEHHSNLDDFDEREQGNEASIRRRLACENWDSPVILTTNVMLLESLFTNKRGRARKLHNIAGSVIILDEAQCVPVGYVALILPMLRDLVENYHCSLVVCTATQPAWRQRKSLPFGFSDDLLRPIIPAFADLFRVTGFDRVKIEWPANTNPISNDELAVMLVGEACVMAIVHRKKAAQWLARKLRDLRPQERIFHLSTNMCPVHRRRVLEEIREGIANFHNTGAACRIVSTQLVESGIDLDLPVVYRAMAGLDSIAQAAGRCNREGRMSQQGRVVVFYSENPPPDHHLKCCAEITGMMLNENEGNLDLRDPDVFEAFFKHLYMSSRLDEKDLQRHVSALNFETVGREFRLIEDSEQVPIVILHDDTARSRLATVRQIAASSAGEAAAVRQAYRALQSYTVAVWPKGIKILRSALEPLFPGSEAQMLDPKLYPESYHATFGLVTDDEPTIPPETLIS